MRGRRLSMLSERLSPAARTTSHRDAANTGVQTTFGVTFQEESDMFGKFMMSSVVAGLCVLGSVVWLSAQPQAGNAAQPPAAQTQAAPAATMAPPSTAYVGSQACRRCHASTYERWSKTRMANVVRDPKEHPEAVLPDFSKPDPALTFTLNDVALVYGSKWKQRYFKKVGDDYVPLGAQWDVTSRVWRPYLVANNTDWWGPFYGPTNNDRPTGPLCDGCHSVNYNIQNKAVQEWNVGCEKCHGPGGDHVKAPTVANIVNPAKL